MNTSFQDRTVLYTIARSQVEAHNIEVVIELFKSLGIDEPANAAPGLLRSLESKIGLVVDGYNEDARELYQISEIRDYFRSIHAQWPYGLFFFCREVGTLQVLVLSHVAVKTEHATSSSKTMVRLPKQQIVEFIESSTGPVFQITERLGWTKSETSRFLGEVAGLFGIKGATPLPESAEEKRSRHGDFIRSQMSPLASIAQSGHHDVGRGAVFVCPPESGNQGCQVTFVSQEMLIQSESLAHQLRMHQMVREYDPESQFVICIAEPDSDDAYLIRIPDPL